MIKKINKIKEKALYKINSANSLEKLDSLRVLYLGKKSEFNQILRSLKDLSSEKKKKIGSLANRVKNNIQESIENRISELEESEDAEKEWIDVTAPAHITMRNMKGKLENRGHLNPLSIVQRDIEDIFTSMGFEIADGPDIETEFYNFDAVNVPDNHPARDLWDTFWISQDKNRKKGSGIVLRTHTSPVQIRYMQKNKPPFRIIVPGRCFRNEATDASHEHTFYQFEALVVGKNVSVANFLYIAETFFAQFFGKEMKIRLRPSYFPFVEPGFEFDISCTNCDGKGCSTCSQTGWIEIGGAGMVHQNVFETTEYKKGEYQGFAWGFGIDRLAMMKYKIDDVRLFHSGDVRFTKQF